MICLKILLWPMCGNWPRARMDTEISAKKLLQESYSRIRHTVGYQ